MTTGASQSLVRRCEASSVAVTAFWVRRSLISESAVFAEASGAAPALEYLGLPQRFLRRERVLIDGYEVRVLAGRARLVPCPPPALRHRRPVRGLELSIRRG